MLDKKRSNTINIIMSTKTKRINLLKRGAMGGAMGVYDRTRLVGEGVLDSCHRSCPFHLHAFNSVTRVLFLCLMSIQPCDDTPSLPPHLVMSVGSHRRDGGGEVKPVICRVSTPSSQGPRYPSPLERGNPLEMISSPSNSGLRADCHVPLKTNTDTGNLIYHLCFWKKGSSKKKKVIGCFECKTGWGGEEGFVMAGWRA